MTGGHQIIQCFIRLSTYLSCYLLSVVLLYKNIKALNTETFAYFFSNIYQVPRTVSSTQKVLCEYLESD